MSMPSSNWAARAFQKTFTNVFYSRVLPTRRRRSRRPAQQISLESLEPRQMLSVNPASSGSTASSATDNSNIAAFVSQNTIGILAVVPGRPTAVVAASGNGQLAVTWTAPASTVGSPITDYLVKYSSNNGVAGSWTRWGKTTVITATACTVTGLANGTAYVIKVIAVNAIGISLPSVNSAPATPAATVPSSPTSVVATSGNTQLAVTWVAPVSDGGSNITDYLVKYSSNSGSTWKNFIHPVSTVPSLTVTGLTNGTAYVIKVIAVNAIGISLPSANSAPATPLAAALTPTFGATTSTTTGFTVQITNYDSSYAWAGTATASGTVVVSSTGLVTVAGLTAGTSSTATITTTKTNTVGGSAPVTATSLAAALTPTFGAPTATADGFTVVITNYDSSYAWAGTATASGTVAINGTGLVTVTNVAPGTSSTATITTTQAGYVGGTAQVTATSLFFAMSMVTVGNPRNAADTGSFTSGYGSVNYSYQIGTYDVTGSQYTAFLNAVGSTDTYALYNASMGIDPQVAQISRSGTAGTYTYAVLNGTGQRPISYVSWFDSARFSNWLANGQPSGAQTSTTTENGAYTLVNGATSGNAVAKNHTNPNTGSAPTYWIPLENEWYKAAYYSPNLDGTVFAGYYVFATQSDIQPGTTAGSSPNQANYNNAINYATEVGSFSVSKSFYGTFDQSGNVFQWNDLNDTAGSTRGLRGGGWYSDSFSASSSGRTSEPPSSEVSSLGFRLASPAPV